MPTSQEVEVSTDQSSNANSTSGWTSQISENLFAWWGHGKRALNLYNNPAAVAEQKLSQRCETSGYREEAARITHAQGEADLNEMLRDKSKKRKRVRFADGTNIFDLNELLDCIKKFRGKNPKLNEDFLLDENIKALEGHVDFIEHSDEYLSPDEIKAINEAKSIVTTGNFTATCNKENFKKIKPAMDLVVKTKKYKSAKEQLDAKNGKNLFKRLREKNPMCRDKISQLEHCWREQRSTYANCTSQQLICITEILDQLNIYRTMIESAIPHAVNNSIWSFFFPQMLTKEQIKVITTLGKNFQKLIQRYQREVITAMLARLSFVSAVDLRNAIDLPIDKCFFDDVTAATLMEMQECGLSKDFVETFFRQAPPRNTLTGVYIAKMYNYILQHGTEVQKKQLEGLIGRQLQVIKPEINLLTIANNDQIIVARSDVENVTNLSSLNSSSTVDSVNFAYDNSLLCSFIALPLEYGDKSERVVIKLDGGADLVPLETKANLSVLAKIAVNLIGNEATSKLESNKQPLAEFVWLLSKTEISLIKQKAQEFFKEENYQKVFTLFAKKLLKQNSLYAIEENKTIFNRARYNTEKAIIMLEAEKFPFDNGKLFEHIADGLLNKGFAVEGENNLLEIAAKIYSEFLQIIDELKVVYGDKAKDSIGFFYQNFKDLFAEKDHLSLQKDSRLVFDQARLKIFIKDYEEKIIDKYAKQKKLFTEVAFKFIQNNPKWREDQKCWQEGIDRAVAFTVQYAQAKEILSEDHDLDVFKSRLLRIADPDPRASNVIRKKEFEDALIYVYVVNKIGDGDVDVTNYCSEVEKRIKEFEALKQALTLFLQDHLSRINNTCCLSFWTSGKKTHDKRTMLETCLRDVQNTYDKGQLILFMHVMRDNDVLTRNRNKFSSSTNTDSTFTKSFDDFMRRHKIEQPQAIASTASLHM